MRVLRILFRAGMAGELLPDFLRNVGVRKCGVEAVAQGMKREARQRSPTARLYQISFNPGFLQNRFKSTVRPNLPPVAFSDARRKHRRFAGAGILQQLSLKLRVHGNRDYLFRLARREPNNLVVPVNGAGRRFVTSSNTTAVRSTLRFPFMATSCEKLQVTLQHPLRATFFRLN